MKKETERKLGKQIEKNLKAKPKLKQKKSKK